MRMLADAEDGSGASGVDHSSTAQLGRSSKLQASRIGSSLHGIAVPGFVTLGLQVFSTSFFMLTFVVLLNLLIAMMSETYSRHQKLAVEEWRLVVAGLTREYWSAAVLPLPLNVFENVINDLMKGCMKERLEARIEAQKERPDAMSELTWGKHYLWPKPAFVAGLREDDLMLLLASGGQNDPRDTGKVSREDLNALTAQITFTTLQNRRIISHMEKVERDIASLNTMESVRTEATRTMSARAL